MQVTAFNLWRPAYRGSEGFPSGWRELLRTDHPPEFRAKGGQAACGVQRIAEPHAAVLTKANFLSRDSRGPLFQGLQLREVGGCSAAGSAGDQRLAQLCWLGEQAMLFPFITPPPEIRLIYSLAALGLCSFWSGRRGACCCAFN